MHCYDRVRGMMRDEVHFPDPDIFSPERHRDIVDAKAGESATQDKQNPAFKDRDPNLILFGFGRR